MVLLKKGMSAAGFLIFLAGLYWLWELRDYWPRATSSYIRSPLLEALGVIIAGLYLVNKGR